MNFYTFLTLPGSPDICMRSSCVISLVGLSQAKIATETSKTVAQGKAKYCPRVSCRQKHTKNLVTLTSDLDI